MNNFNLMKDIVNLYFNSSRSLIPLYRQEDGTSLKRPILKKWENRELHNFTLPQLIDYAEKGHGFGYRIKPNEVIIDVDVSKGKKGLESFEKLQRDLGITLFPTVKTGSGGYHVYLTLPSTLDLSTFYVRNEYESYPDVEFKRYPKQVVVPASPHESGNKYELLDKQAISKPNAAPTPLIEFFEQYNNSHDTHVENYSSDSEITQWDNFNATTIPFEDVEKYLQVYDVDNYNDWQSVAFALHNEDPSFEGEYFKLFDKWSKTSKKYTPVSDSKTNEKSPADLWKTIGKDKSKKRLLTAATLKKRYNLEFKNRQIKKNLWWEEWVYDYSDSKTPYVNIHNLQKISSKGMEHTFYDRIPLNEKGKPICSSVARLLSKVNPISVTAVVYRPDKPDGIFYDNKLSYLNSYSKSNKPQAAKAISFKTREYIKHFENHVLYLCDDNEESASHLLQFLAFNVQYPGRLKGHGILIQGKQGTGKTIIAELMVKVLGQRNCKELRNGDLMEKYTAWANDASLRYIEELKIPNANRYHADEKMKTPLTNEMVTVRAMYTDTKPVKNVTNYIAFTNHNDAIPAYEGETRWFHISSSKEPKSPSDYDKLYSFENDSQLVAEMVKYFEDYPISERFKKKQRAPMTRDKQQAIAAEQLRTEWVAEIEEELTSGNPHFNKDVVIFSHLKSALKIKNIDAYIDNRKLSAILRRHFDFTPYVNEHGNSCAIRIKGERVRVWLSKKHKNLTRVDEVRKLFDDCKDLQLPNQVKSEKEPDQNKLITNENESGKVKLSPTLSPLYNPDDVETNWCGKQTLDVLDTKTNTIKNICVNPDNYTFDFETGHFIHKETGKVKKRLSKKDSVYTWVMVAPGEKPERSKNWKPKEDINND